MQNDWAYREFSHLSLWDERCRPSLINACTLLAENAETSLSRALGSSRKAVSRIIHHKTIKEGDLLGGHVIATAKRCEEHELVLIASDTTPCDFTTLGAATAAAPVAPAASRNLRRVATFEFSVFLVMGITLPGL